MSTNDTDADTPPWQDAATLRREYCRRGHERTDLAERWGCAVGTIDKWLRHHEITKRWGQPWQDAETLEYLYHERRYTMADIARWFPVTWQSVRYWIEEHDLQREHGNGQYDDDYLLDHLRAVHDDVEFRVTMTDLNQRDGPSPKPYKTRWGSWSAALEAAGLDPDARTRPPAKSDRRAMDLDQAQILTARREAALELRATADPWRFHAVDISKSDFYKFLYAGLIHHASAERIPDEEGLLNYRAYEWELAQGVRGWIDTHLTQVSKCPAEGCDATGIRNPRDAEGYRCTSDECDRHLTREEAEALL